MTLVDSAPRVREYTLSEGDGKIVLDRGRSHGALRFVDVMQEDDECDIVIAYDGQFEECRATMDSDGNLDRGDVYWALHSNGTVDQNHVIFPAGEKTVIMTAAPILRNTVRYDIPQTLSAGQLARVRESLPITFGEIGTRTVFHQNTVPLGWVKDTSRNDYGLRIVSGDVGDSGSVPYSTLHARTATDSFVLGLGHLAAHLHGGFTNTVPDHSHAFQRYDLNTTGVVGSQGGISNLFATTYFVAPAGAHDHIIETTMVGSNAPFSMPIDMRVMTIAMVIGERVAP